MQFSQLITLTVIAVNIALLQPASADATSNSRPTAQVQDRLAGAPAPAATAKDAVDVAMSDLYRARDKASYEQAVAAIQQLADAGNATAAMRLGRFFHLEHRPPDYARALKLYTQAMQQGDNWATNNIGLMYEEGKGVPADIGKAIEFYQLAAQRGQYRGYTNLARIYFTGNGVKRDRNAAESWLNKGMRSGLIEVYQEATSIYYYGRYGEPIDYAKALRYEEAAGNLGSRDSAWRAAKMYLDGVGTPKDAAKAMEAFNRLASLNDPAAINSLGSMYSTGNGVPMDKHKAVEYWERSAAMNYCVSLRNLGNAYDRGWGVGVDVAKATEYIAKAASCGVPPEGFDVWKLATRYRDGTGLARDCSAAEKLFSQSITLGYTDAITDLGSFYQHGCDAKQPDAKAAFRTYLWGAKQGLSLCQNNVGAMLKHGYGVDSPDRIKAFAWLSLAAENGNDIAKKNLEDFASMFSAEDREKGSEHLQTVKQMIIKPGQSPRAAMDDTY